MNKKLSVIVPVYNVQNYLPRCIESILAQTFRELELILVDDGATDLSGEICDQYAEKDERVRVIHQRNQGVSVARNVGLEASKGEIIGFVDADDWIASDMYEILISDLELYHADIAICGLVEKYINDRDYEKENLEIEPFILDSEKAIESMFLLKKNNEIVWGTRGACNRVYRKKLFINIKFKADINFAEDFLVSWELFHKSEKIVCRPVKKYCYRQIINSRSYKDFEGKYESSLKVFSEIYQNTIKFYPKLGGIVLDLYVGNLLWCATGYLNSEINKKTEFYKIKNELKLLKCEIFSCKEVSFNKKKQILLCLLPYFISKKLFIWKIKKNDLRKHLKRRNYYE